MDEELCPSCGRLVEYLDEETGWCLDCAGISTTSNSYLQANADTLEHYIATGQASNVHQAIDLLADVKTGHRPTCIVCGNVIKHAPRTSVFCRKNPECRRMSRRYIYLYTQKGMTKVAAFATIMQELGAE